MKMTLSQVLRIADVNKPVYDARRRRQFLHWMEDSEVFDFPADSPAQAYVAKRERYGIEHATALVAFENLVSKVNLPLEVADYIIGNRAGDIFSAIANRSLGPADTEKNLFIGVIRYAGDQWRNHLFGTLSHCVDKYIEAQREGSHSESITIGLVPASLVLIDLSEVYLRTIDTIIEKISQ